MKVNSIVENMWNKLKFCHWESKKAYENMDGRDKETLLEIIRIVKIFKINKKFYNWGKRKRQKTTYENMDGRDKEKLLESK